MVVNCKESITDCIPCSINEDNEVEYDIYEAFNKEIQSGIVKTMKMKLRKKITEDGQESGLLSCLYSCLLLHNQYREMLHSLRDSLGGANALQHAAIIPETRNKKMSHAAVTALSVQASSVSHTTSIPNPTGKSN